MGKVQKAIPSWRNLIMVERTYGMCIFQKSAVALWMPRLLKLAELGIGIYFAPIEQTDHQCFQFIFPESAIRPVRQCLVPDFLQRISMFYATSRRPCMAKDIQIPQPQGTVLANRKQIARFDTLPEDEPIHYLRIMAEPGVTTSCRFVDFSMGRALYYPITRANQSSIANYTVNHSNLWLSATRSDFDPDFLGDVHEETSNRPEEAPYPADQTADTTTKSRAITSERSGVEA